MPAPAPSIMALFTLGGCVSFVLAAFVTDTTLKRRYSAAATWLTWLGFAVLYFGISFAGYMINPNIDVVSMLGLLVLPPIPAVLLYKDDRYSKMFISIMAALIASITTFLFCGTTLNLVDNSAMIYGTPYNMVTVPKFVVIKVIWSVVAYIIYVKLAAKTVREVVDILGEKMKRYLFIPIVTYVSFSIISVITNMIGLLPGVMPGFFVVFYLVVCLNFGLTFFEIFSTALWNSRAEKTEAELNVASNIQRDMLPCIFPPFPDRKEFDIYATMEPAKEVGGDFYDFFLVDENRLAVVMADVSGKGVPAALFMVIAKTLIKNYTSLTENIAEVFNNVNNQLCENNAENMFVTAFMGILDMRDHSFTYVNAGHNAPLFSDKEGRFQWLPMDAGFVLAGMEGMTYETNQIVLEPGQTLFLYTDGVTEALNPRLDLYSDERLIDLLNTQDAAGKAPEELLSFVRQDIVTFASGAEQADDITMLALRIME